MAVLDAIRASAAAGGGWTTVRPDRLRDATATGLWGVGCASPTDKMVLATGLRVVNR